jgi:pyruvate dehydrogenase E2 component (dihydrolipoamide acetyltransferase)
MSVFLLPDLGEGLLEAEIVRWHVAVGDTVVRDQPLVTIETDKAVVDVPSPQSGRIVRFGAEPGGIVRVGEVLVEFDDGKRADTGTVVGEIPRDSAAAITPGARETRASKRVAGAAGVKAVPGVRGFARRLGVKLADLDGTGPDKTITRADVERAASGATLASGFTALRGPRRAMAGRMAAAHAEVVPATVCDDADIDAWTPETDVTARLIRAVAAGAAAEPSLNAWYDGKQNARRVHDRVDLGVAVDTEHGLFVPVIRNVTALEAAELRSAVDRLRTMVADRTIPIDELQGQTITLSNFGMITGRYASLVVVPPQVAIVGVGRIDDRAVACEGRTVLHRTLPLSLTFDHRAVTGGEAARFLAAVVADLQSTGE